MPKSAADPEADTSSDSESDTSCYTEAVDATQVSDTENHPDLYVQSPSAMDAFQSPRSRELFEAIDELRSCGANRDIELPELVIVGDQSAGKSSLLQSLTDIPFPVAGRLCTRFPTRIISRRAHGAPDLVKVSIEPSIFNLFDGESYETRLARYDTLKRSFSSFTAEDFTNVVEEATILLGIKVPSQGSTDSSQVSGSRNFSADVLKIEISGPTRSHFSILDVPGIFHSATGGLTPNEMNSVKLMVAGYMIPQQSILIFVASAASDLATQGALEMVTQHDKGGERTVGVVTKCDLSQTPEDTIRVAKNQEKELRHGWFVVRNRTPAESADDISSTERHQRETKMFEESPWNELDPTRRGTQMLKQYLAHLFCKRIEKAFPVLLASLQSRRDKAQKELESLGSPRTTIGQKRQYLTRIAESLYSISSQSLRGRYDSIQSSKAKVRMHVRDINDAFAVEMKEKGHSVSFVQIQERVSSSETQQERGLPTPPCSRGSTPKKNQETTASRNSDLWPESSDTGIRIFNLPKGQPKQIDPKNTDIYKWIRQEIKNNRGTELQGTLNPDVLPVLFHRQAHKWKEIASRYLLNIRAKTLLTMTHLLDESCTDTNTRQKILPLIERADRKAGDIRLTQMTQYVENVLSKHLQTNNETLETKIAALRKRRFHAALLRYKDRLAPIPTDTPKPPTATPPPTNHHLIIDTQNTDALFRELHFSNAQNLEDEIHDTLQAYYEIARENLVEYMARNVVEPYLNDAEGPVLVFSAVFVGGLGDEVVEKLAGEDEGLVLRREGLVGTIGRLERAEEIAGGYA